MTNDELNPNEEIRKKSVIVRSFVVRASTFLRRSSLLSFVAEGFDGVERGGFACGIKAEEHANGCAE
jgi:hypothetical protein